MSSTPFSTPCAGDDAIRDPVDLLQRAVGNRYLVEREIGRGGAARVFLARDVPHQRAVAIKLMHPDLAVSPERFLREILILASLQHPNIVPLFDSGLAGDVPYYVMPFVEGEALRSRLDSGRPVPVAEAIDIALEVADALEYAHSRGLIHRDVKPENILLSDGHAMLSDFGIARAMERAMDSRTTASGFVLGTPAYMSPEQAFGELEADQRSDQYSLACVLYEMLYGSAPHGRGTPRSQLRKVADGVTELPRQTRNGVPVAVANALLRALSTEPEARFESMAEFAGALIGRSGHAEWVPRSRFARLSSFADGVAPSRGVRILFLASLATTMLAGVTLAVKASRGSSEPSEAAVSLDPKRIAVLYFDDHSADQSLAYLASGLTEGLISELSGISALQVISRNGVKPYRHAVVALDSIARALRVGIIVEGSVQRSANRVRVTMQMTDARTGAHLGSSTIEREFGDLFLLEDEMARRVASDLRRRLGVEVRLRTRQAETRSARARELMWRADGMRSEADTLASSKDADGLARAVRLSLRADSLLALTEAEDRRWHAPIVDRGWIALDIAMWQTGAVSDSAFRSSMTHAERVLARAPDHAAALELRGTSRYLQAERGGLPPDSVSAFLLHAQRDLRRAVSLDSSLATAWWTLSRVQRSNGDMADALHAAEEAFAKDAYLGDTPSVLQTLFGAALMNDELTSAWRWCERGARDYPNDVRFVQCRLMLAAQDPDKPADPAIAAQLAATAHRLDPPQRARARGKASLPIIRDMLYAMVLARAGSADSARAVAARSQRSAEGDSVTAYDVMYEAAYLDLLLGDTSSALQRLSSYATERPYLRGLVRSDPRWKSLRTMPSFQQLVRSTTETSR